MRHIRTELTYSNKVTERGERLDALQDKTGTPLSFII